MNYQRFISFNSELLQTFGIHSGRQQDDAITAAATCLDERALSPLGRQPSYEAAPRVYSICTVETGKLIAKACGEVALSEADPHGLHEAAV